MNNSPPPPPSRLIRMVIEAISSLKAKSGSSQPAIAKFIEEKYYVGGLPQNFNRILSTQLNELTKSGRLVKVKRSFKLPVTEKLEKISKEKRIKVKEAEGEMILGIRKYVDKYERLSEMKIPKKSTSIELIQKEKADLEEWKKVAAISRVP